MRSNLFTTLTGTLLEHQHVFAFSFFNVAPVGVILLTNDFIFRFTIPCKKLATLNSMKAVAPFITRVI